MPFNIILTELVGKVPGALGAVLADWEGEAIDQVACIDDYELRVVGAHKGIILSNLREVVHRLKGDRLREIVITTEKNQYLVLPITEEYFLVLVLERSAILGKAQFEAKLRLPRLHAELA